MSRRMIALSCTFALFFSGCALRAAVEESHPPEGAFQIYYAAAGESVGGAAVGFEYRQPAAEKALVPALVDLLLEGPQSTMLKSPFRPGVSLLSYGLEDGQLHLDLSEQYGGLSGVDLTIASYCFALTLCQVEGVDCVYLTVEGKPLPPVLAQQQLRAEDVILSGAEEQPVQVEALLWFARTDGAGLGVESRTLLKTERESMAQLVLTALLNGPVNEDFISLIPEGTQVEGIYVKEDGVCVLDLSASFQENLPQDPVQAKYLLYCLVNTLCSSLDAVQSVQIQAGGQVIASFGEIPTNSPIEPDFTLER